MANLIESPIFEVGVYQIEQSDPVMGGPNGISNRQGTQLANRTQWLKSELAKAVSEIGISKVDKTIQVIAGNGLSGGGTLSTNRTLSVDFATNAEAKIGTINNKAASPNAIASNAFYHANSRYDGSLSSGDANDFEVGTRYLCSNAVSNIPNLNVWWDGYYSFIETRYSHSSGQKIQVAWGYDKPNLAMRIFVVGVWSDWKSTMGADWASTSSDGIRNKPTTADGFGLTDVYTKTQADNLLAVKATKSTTLTGYGIGDAYTKAQVDSLLNTKAAKANTIAGYGISDAYTSSQTDALLNAKATKSTTLAGYGITDGATKKELLTIPSTIATLPETITQPMSLVNIAVSDGMKNHSGFTYIQTIQYGSTAQWSQLANPYTSAAAPKLYGRHSYQGTDSSWGRIDGADWNAGSTDTGYIDNKPTTLLGYGITDWVVKSYAGNTSVVANAIGNGVHSYGAGATDAPSWVDGSPIGANKVIQFGTSAWDSQISTQAYGECTFIRSRSTINGAYQSWKRLDGGDWNATEKTAGFISNKPTTFAALGIANVVSTDTAQTINGAKSFINTATFNSTGLVGWASWQDTIHLNGTLPAISNSSFGIGFHTADRMIYLMDIENQSYLATFNFSDSKATFTGVLNASGGLFKGAVEAAYSNIQIQAGTGLTGGGTLATTRVLNIDKATAAQLTAGTADKVLTADIAKTALDTKANSAITLTAGIGLKGLGNLTANRSVEIDKATAAQLTAGTVNKVITADILATFLNKTYTDVTSSRNLGVNYINNTGYEISVHVDGRVDGGGSSAVAYVNGVVVNRLFTISQTGTSVIGTFSFVVPNGATYQVVGMGTAHSSAPYKWVEYR